ncbi:MAG: hypothetical protein DHS80DRAFT_32699 [Piptocephalis tieghemiana]|nr:MAG: hypothetical protein DHS80DRAFT_32699 [Piptocephalis tieghemiana]
MSRIASFVCGALASGTLFYYLTAKVHDDAHLMALQLQQVKRRLEISSSGLPYTRDDLAVPERHEAKSAPLRFIRHYETLVKTEVIPRWKASWNRGVRSTSAFLNSWEVDLGNGVVRRKVD